MTRLFAILGILVSAPHALAQATPERPNVIWIMADDLGYGDLGCYGQQLIQTPRLDQMAAEGLRFTQFYAGATVCAPSRCVLMTGQHTGRARVRGNSAKHLQTLDDANVTVAEVLKEAGYVTALCGKWGLGEEGTTGLPNDQGFDFFYGYLNQHHAHNYYPAFLWRNKARVPLRNVVAPKGDDPYGVGWATERIDYSHDLIMEEGLQWLEANHDRPFFLYLALTIPHANNEGSRGTGDGQEVPDYGVYADRDWTNPNKGQAAMITRMDRDVGRVLDLLVDRQIADRTLVLFTSDNGHHQEGNNDPEFFDANGPLRGMKRDLYEGGIRAPTIVWQPGAVAAGESTEFIGYSGDLMATVCDLVRVAPPDPELGLQSVSLAPTLYGRGEQQQHEYLYWEFYERGSAQAVRFGDWKAVRKPMIDGDVELFNLAVDLGEENDVAGEHPEIVKQAVSYLDEAHVEDPRWRRR